MRNKIIEYIEQLEKSYENYMVEYYKTSDRYYAGMADSVRATINDLDDLLNNITYRERLDKILQTKELENETN